jgi:hypothetical protein
MASHEAVKKIKRLILTLPLTSNTKEWEFYIKPEMDEVFETAPPPRSISALMLTALLSAARFLFRAGGQGEHAVLPQRGTDFHREKRYSR